MTSILVDDSRLARNELRHLLESYPEIEVVAEAAHAQEAKAQIEKKHPDLLFLDIQMPGKDGFQLLEELDHTPYVIFTTAYDQYALRAFETSALDYLLKPIRDERLKAAIERVHQKNQVNQVDLAPSSEFMRLDQQVFVKDGDQCWFVKLNDIRLFEINGKQTRIYFASHAPLIHRTLHYLETRLDEAHFFRANRQQIINLAWIDRIVPWFSGGLKVFLKEGGEEIEISRRQASRFKDLLSF